MSAVMQDIDTASVSVLDMVADAEALRNRIIGGRPGDRITYWVGLLARDRDAQASSLLPERRAALHMTATAVMRFAEAKWVYLLQQRVAPDCCAYIAVVRHRPRSVALPPMTRRRLPQRDRALTALLGGAAA